MKIFKLLFLSGFVLVSSCNHQNEKDLYPDQLASCDTSNLTFNSRIIFLLAEKCFACHSHPVADLWGDAIHLETYADVTSRIKQISDAINHTGKYLPMPENGDKLDACTLMLIDTWINKGMPEK